MSMMRAGDMNNVKGTLMLCVLVALSVPAAPEVRAQAVGAVRPVLECVDPPATPRAPFVARFGYLNSFATAQTIPTGPLNRLVPVIPANPALPTVFDPGRQVDVFTVEFNGAPLVWVLTDPGGQTRTSTASSGSKPCPPPCAPVSGDMLGWWRGEDAVTAEVGPDLVGSPQFGTGVVGRGLVVDGQSVLTVDGFPWVRDAVSVEMWVKPAITGMTQTLVSQWTVLGGRNDDAYSLTITPFGDLEWLTDGPTNRWSDRARIYADSLFDGRWHHVAATWTPAATVVYLDGVPVLEKASREPHLNEVGTQFRIGSSSGRGNPFWFTGELDEPSVFGRALSEAEVSSIFQAGSTGKCR